MSDSPNSPSQNAYPPQTVVVQKEKSGCGCFALGCLGLVGGAIVLLALMVGGSYWFFSSQVQKYTSDTPAEIPVVEYTEEEVAELQARIDAFKSGVQDTTADPDAPPPAAAPPRELVLTAEEINALIAADEDLRGRVYVSIEEGDITGDVSIPTDMFPGGKGRFLNASATFNVSMENGVLFVKIVRAEVKGEPVPEAYMQEISKQNLARDLYKDEQTAEVLRKFESVRVEGDKLILRRREPAESSAETSESSAGEAPAVDDSSPAGDAAPGADVPPTGDGAAVEAEARSIVD